MRLAQILPFGIMTCELAQKETVSLQKSEGGNPNVFLKNVVVKQQPINFAAEFL